MSGNYNRKDHLYQKAKSDGYRSRAAFKLIEINKKYRFIRPSSKVLDLGAWPGGWLQVVAEHISSSGVAVGVDLVEIEDLGNPHVHGLQGNVSDPEVMQRALAFAGGSFDLVLSDMSPKLTGIREVDQAATSNISELALSVALNMLSPGGSLVLKVFKNQASDLFFKRLKRYFSKVDRLELDATRNTSNEYYIIGLKLLEQDKN